MILTGFFFFVCDEYAAQDPAPVRPAGVDHRFRVGAQLDSGDSDLLPVPRSGTARGVSGLLSQRLRT